MSSATSLRNTSTRSRWVRTTLKEDITEYISKNTIIPFLFDSARKACKIAFEGETSIWQLLSAAPDRYIYDAVKTGVELELPEEISAGFEDVSKRTEWNTPAPDRIRLAD